MLLSSVLAAHKQTRIEDEDGRESHTDIDQLVQG